MFGQVHSYETQQSFSLTSTKMESSGQLNGGWGQSQMTELQSVVVPGRGLVQMVVESAVLVEGWRVWRGERGGVVCGGVCACGGDGVVCVCACVCAHVCVGCVCVYQYMYHILIFTCH